VFGSVYAGGPERPSRRSTSRSTTSYPEPHRPAPEARASLSRAYSDVVTASPSWPTTTTPRVGSWRARSIAALTASRSRQPTRHAVTLDDGLARLIAPSTGKRSRRPPYRPAQPACRGSPAVGKPAGLQPQRIQPPRRDGIDTSSLRMSVPRWGKVRVAAQRAKRMSRKGPGEGCCR
jgi:hypothetical protein